MKIEQNDFELQGNMGGENGGIEVGMKIILKQSFECFYLNCIMNYDDQNIGNDYNNTTFYIVLSDRFVR